MVEKWLNKRIFFILLLAVLLIISMYLLWGILLPFLVGLLIAYLLDPIVKFLENNKKMPIKRGLSVTLIFLIFISIFTFLSITLYQTLKPNFIVKIIEDMPQYGEVIEKEYNSLAKKLELSGLNLDTEEIRQKIFKEAEDFFRDFLSSLKNLFSGLFSSVIFLFLVPLSTFYFLKDKEKIFKTIKNYVKDEKEVQIKVIYEEINHKIGGYLKGLLLTSLIMALTVTVFLLFFPALRPYAILFGVIAGIANVVPYLGQFIGATGPIIIAIANYDFQTIMIIVLFFVGLNVLVGFYITPKITSAAVNIHPLTVIISILMGNALFGITGMLLAVPIAIIIKVLLLVVLKSYIKEF